MDPTLHLATMPLWLSGAIIVGGITLLALLGPVLTRRFIAYERLSANNEVAGFKFATLGVVYAVLLAFAVIVVWEKFRDAEEAVSQEAGALAALYRLSIGLDTEAQTRLRTALARYTESAITEDWPAMARGTASRDTTRALTEAYAAALTLDPSHPRGEPILSAILDQLDQLTTARRKRLGLATGVVPGILWTVLYLGAILTIGFTFFFGTENLRAQALMSAMLALVISMSLYVVVVVDHPFTGSVSVPPEALEAVQNAFADAALGGAHR